MNKPAQLQPKLPGSRGLSSTAARVVGPRHEQGGVPLSNGQEVEGGEVIIRRGDAPYVFSDRLIDPNTGRTFARAYDKLPHKRPAEIFSLVRRQETARRMAGQAQPGKLALGGMLASSLVPAAINIGMGLFGKNHVGKATKADRSAMAYIPGAIDDSGAAQGIDSAYSAMISRPGMSAGSMLAANALRLSQRGQLQAQTNQQNLALASTRAQMAQGYDQMDSQFAEQHRSELGMARRARQGAVAAGISQIGAAGGEYFGAKYKQALMDKANDNSNAISLAIAGARMTDPEARRDFFGSLSTLRGALSPNVLRMAGQLATPATPPASPSPSPVTPSPVFNLPSYRVDNPVYEDEFYDGFKAFGGKLSPPTIASTRKGYPRPSHEESQEISSRAQQMSQSFLSAKEASMRNRYEAMEMYRKMTGVSDPNRRVADSKMYMSDQYREDAFRSYRGFEQFMRDYRKQMILSREQPLKAFGGELSPRKTRYAGWKPY